MITEFFLSTLKINFGCFEMNQSPLGRAGFFRDGDSLARIAHFLNGRRSFAAHSECDSGDY